MSTEGLCGSPDDEQLHLLRLINGFQVTQAIYVVVTLGIPDLLRDGPLPSEQIAVRTGAHAGALYRVLRALAAVGLLHEHGERHFALTSLGRGLASGVPGSRNAWARFVARPPVWEAWGELLHSVQTGETGFRHVHGKDVWEFRAGQPAENAIFDLAMREGSQHIAGQLLTAYDFTRFLHIIDVGGGDGALLAGLLVSCPETRGTLFDQPHVVTAGAAVLEEVGVAGRCSVVAGSFFEAVPGDGDAYILKHILHDWEDDQAVRILRTCRTAMPFGAQLLVIERMLGPANEGAEGKLSDLNMLVNAGGRERTRDEFAALLAGAGFVLQTAHPLPMGRFVIQAIPN